MSIQKYASDSVRDDREGEQPVESEEEPESAASESSHSSDEEEDVTPAQSYASLLKALKPKVASFERPAKRRKLSNPQQEEIQDVEALQEDAADEAIEDADSVDEQEIDSDNEDFVLSDPFEQHYANMVEDELQKRIDEQQQKPTTTKIVIAGDIRKQQFFHGSNIPIKHRSKGLSLKKRLIEPGSELLRRLDSEEIDLQHEIFDYRDILFGHRILQNTPQLRDITALHALNHILKTRDRVLKNNAKLAQDSTGDFRDQGFTRPKVLVLLPTKQACVRYVESIVKLSKPDQQENKSRLLDTFSLAADDTFEHKPDDFRELFGGNHEEDFRVGLKFTRKTIKFFSGFYNSDIILASPLGLMRTVTTGGGKKEKKGHDSDFLSSIEVLIMDHANALEMQNWQHVDYVFSQLNLLPKESHDCDFNRARHWYLDGKAKYLRQTIILSEYLTPSISALASTYLHNIAGRVKYTPAYSGSMLNLPAAMPLSITQTFLRFEPPTPQNDSDVRFKFFTSTILPQLLRSTNKASNRGTLIYVPTYLDFVRLRNHFSTATEAISLAFGAVSEYSPRGDVARARSHFTSGRQSVLLYSERAHHYFRYKLRGVRRLIFYGLPENPIFWSELIDALSVNAQHDLEWAQSQKGRRGKGLVRALFSKWDVMKLERVVGTDRVARLVSDKEGDVFDFV